MQIIRSSPGLPSMTLERSGVWYRDVLGCDVMKAPRDEPWGMRELALRSPDGHHFTLGQAIQPT